MDMPMLTEEEWEQVGPHLADKVSQIKRYRHAHGCSLAEATAKGFGLEALLAYEKITGFNETNANALFHHRLSMYGPPCHSCGELLRTPEARYCANCSAKRQTIETVGQ